MQAQSVTLDFLKPVGTVVDLSDKFNARVGDSMTPFNLFVTEGGKPKALNGLHPELEAAVGDGELKDGKVVMSDNAKGIHWIGNAKNVTGYNRLTLTFPAEVFPQSGFCYGHLILANDARVRESSVDIWFKILDGLEVMGLAADYYDSAIELELKKLKEANSQAEQRLSKMKATPEGFANLDDLKAKYPIGNSNLNVTVDDGHLWIWLNGGWRDCGQYQAAGLQEVFKTDFNNFRNSVFVAMYQYQLSMSKQLDDFTQQTGETVQSRSGAFHLKGIDLLDQNGNQILDQIGRKVQVEQLLPITDYCGDQVGLPADSSIVGQTFLTNINRYGTMVIYLDNLDLPNLKKEDGKLKKIPFHISNPKGDLPENGVLDAIKVQGASSAFFDKKNYTINFKERHTVNGWARSKKFVLKGDWNDFSHLRNVGSAKLWANIRKSAIKADDVLMINDNDALIDNDNNNIVGEADSQLGIGQGYGAIDGFPCFLVINKTYWGLYNFNIPKDGIMARMSGHGKEAIVSAKDWAPETLFKGPITIKDDGTPDYKGFEVEYVADEDNQSWIGTSLNTLINAVDASYDTDQAWVDEVSKYLDFGSAIDHFILTVLTDDQDGTSKNYLLQTWNGKKWYFASYDMDSTFGQHEAYGRKLEAPNRKGHISFDNYNNKLMWLIAKRCKQQLYDRYRQLRSGVLSEINVNGTLENYAMQIPKDAYEYESKRWPSTPGTSVKTLYQLENWYRLSSNLIDKKVEGLSGQQN